MKKILPLLILVLLAGFIVILFIKSSKLIIIPPKKSTPSTAVNEKTGGLINYSEAGFSLEILSPQDQSVVSDPNLLVKGKTTAGAEVFINDLQLTADSQGNFQANLVLDEGENTILIVANDQEGNFAEKELTVTLQTEE